MIMATANDFQKTAESVWNALDKLSEKNPEEYKRFIDKQLKEGAESLSPPQPAYCLTCSVTYKGNKVKLFMNICKWSKLPAPKGDTDPIPVKGGVLRHMVDKSGKQLSDLIYDVAFNPTVINECSSVSVLREMLHSLILDFVTDMLKVQVDRATLRQVSECTYKGLEKDIGNSLDERRHLISKESQLDMRESILDELAKVALSSESKDDTLPPLRVNPQRDNTKKLIEELPDRNEEEKKRNRRKKKPVKKAPLYTITSTDKYLEVTVDLPGVNKASDVDIDTSEDDISLEVKDKYKLNISLPKLIMTDEVKAKLNINKHQLILTLPLQSS